jgi:hypothetical protein
MMRFFLNMEQWMLSAFVNRLLHRPRKQKDPLKDVSVRAFHSMFTSPNTRLSNSGQIHRLC